MAKLQYIHDEAGEPQFVVLPIAEYQQLISNAKYDDIPYVADHDDDQTIPNEVVQIMVNDGVSLLAAWRIYRGFSQYEIAELLGTTQSAVSQWEAVDSRPQKKTREKLAEIYKCRAGQMIL